MKVESAVTSDSSPHRPGVGFHTSWTFVPCGSGGNVVVVKYVGEQRFTLLSHLWKQTDGQEAKAA